MNRTERRLDKRRGPSFLLSHFSMRWLSVPKILTNLSASTDTPLYHNLFKKHLIRFFALIVLTTLIYSNTLLSQLVETKLTASDGTQYDLFGHSVAVSGDFAIIGAPYDNHDPQYTGSAYVFKREGSAWTEQLRLFDSTSSQFGFSVAISGDFAITSALSDYSIQGRPAVHIYHRVDENWIREAKVTPFDVTGNDGFGVSTSVSGDYAIVGAPFDSDLGPSSGSAYVFKREGASWVQQAKLTASDGSAYDDFGVSVSLSGDYALIGASNDDGFKGSAYVFMRDAESWYEQAKLVASDRSRGDMFGASVSLDGPYAMIGADSDTIDGTRSGSAYIFRRDGSIWAEQEKLTGGPERGDNDAFGHSVSISGDHALAGVVGSDQNGFNTGLAYLYRRDQSSWVEVNRLWASDAAPEDGFGGSVSIDINYVVVGSSGGDDNEFNSGAAYVFSGFLDSSLAQFGVCYGSTGSAEPTNPGALITIDPLTGAGTLVGPTGIIGEDGPAVRALAIKSTGEMYAMSNTASSDLYSVNASTGAGTFVVNTGLLRPGDIVFDADDVLYSVDETNILYTVDEVTGKRTLVGATGVTLGGLAYDPTDGTMYGSGINDDIYTIDVTTGAVTLVGTTGLGGNIPDIHFDQAGNLYGSKRGAGGIYDFISIDKTTGAGTVIGSTGFFAVVGLATRLIPVPATDDLLLYYPFHGSAIDESGNGNHGTVIGATLATDRLGNENSAYYFDGDDHIDFPVLWNSPPNGLTSAQWVNADQTAGPLSIVYHGDNGEIGMGIENGLAQTGVHLSNGLWYFLYAPVQANTWNYLVMTYLRGDYFRFYLNGALVDSLLLPDLPLLDTGPDYLPSVAAYAQCRTYYGCRGFEGTIDEVRIYDRALTSNEILELYLESTTPARVSLLFPPNNAVITSDSVMVFLWNQSFPYVDFYWFELSADSMFSQSEIDSTITDTLTFVYDLVNNQAYWWRVRAHNELGWGQFSNTRNFRIVVTTVEEDPPTPLEFNLSQNYPNPFNASTTFRYALAEDTHVTFSIYNTLGQLVRVLVDQDQVAGYNEVVWDGRNGSGASVASGIYIYRIAAREFVATKRMFLLR